MCRRVDNYMRMNDWVIENEREYVYAELGATMRHVGSGAYPNESITASERQPSSSNHYR